MSVHDQDPFNISKARKRDKVAGSAQAVGGLAIAGGVPAVSRGEQKLQAFRTQKVDRKIEQTKAKMPTKPSAELRRISGGNTSAEPARAKVQRHLDSKKIAGELNSLNAKRKRIAKPRVYNKQTALWAAGSAVGIPLSYMGARKAVSKADKKDVNAAYAGGIGGFAGYQGGSLALKPLDRRAERKISESPEHSKKQKAYQDKARPKKLTAGDPAWRGYFRNYPKDLPGGKLKRTLAVTHTGRSGTALTAAATVGGAALAVKANRNRDKVKKMANDPFEISKLGVPKNPLASLARAGGGVKSAVKPLKAVPKAQGGLPGAQKLSAGVSSMGAKVNQGIGRAGMAGMTGAQRVQGSAAGKAMMAKPKTTAAVAGGTAGIGAGFALGQNRQKRQQMTGLRKNDPFNVSKGGLSAALKGGEKFRNPLTRVVEAAGGKIETTATKAGPGQTPSLIHEHRTGGALMKPKWKTTQYKGAEGKQKVVTNKGGGLTREGKLVGAGVVGAGALEFDRRNRADKKAKLAKSDAAPFGVAHS